MKTLIIAAIVAIAATAIASAQSASPTTLKFTESDAHFKFVDVKPLGKKKITEGDTLVIGGTVKGGTTNIVCTATQPGRKALFDCTGVLHTGRGDITVTGISSSVSTSDTFAITGGTGAYAGARGTVTSKDAGKHDDLTATFTTS